MTSYKTTWITNQLAVGSAPMSYDELESLRNEGVNAIVNLCAEYCDLHEIEKDYGFEVYYFPVVDDEAPKLEEMERALEWLDEAIYLGKRVLVHCRMGIGRTGTFITSYLLRRGFGMKLAQKQLKKIRSSPSSFAQWRLLRKYGKQEGRLTIREPSLEGSRLVDLALYFSEYEVLLGEVNEAFNSFAASRPEVRMCGKDNDACCNRLLNLQLIEAAYLNYHLNKSLTQDERVAAIHRAIAAGKAFSKEGGSSSNGGPTGPVRADGSERSGAMIVKSDHYSCPLNVGGRCVGYPFHPLACRVYGMPTLYEGRLLGPGNGESAEQADVEPFSLDDAYRKLYEISRRLFFALNGSFLESKSLIFPITNVVSGKFVQDYFVILSKSAEGA